ncbi:aminopeptidase [Clostridium sp. AN503]|uniref:aminopeptidase n=1 Tax=Clostridium sp. AN503 TaxID=3160598 RepID=UPI00345AB5C4
MKDSRIERMARQVVEYSVHLKPGEKVLIDVWDEAYDFAAALMDAAQKAGAYPYLNLQSMALNRRMIMASTEESMEAWYRYENYRMEDMDAYIVVRKNNNIRVYEGIPAGQMKLYNQYYGKLHYGTRLVKTKWCVLRYPNDSFAQTAGMSTEALEDFFFDTCCLNYKRMNELAAPLNELMMRSDRVEIRAPGTELSFSVKGCCKPSACGIFNIPCGETGMPIIPESANGCISYNLPSFFQNTLFEGIRLTLKDGIITEAVSSHQERMDQILDTDENARRIGEFAMGFNPYITRPVQDTLFDEKMAMSMHFTPGNDSIYNPSAIHWDMVTSHDKKMGGGEIYVDGVLIRKDGLFVLDELKQLNPDNLKRELEKAAL